MKIQKFNVMLLQVLLIVLAVSTAEVFSGEQQKKPADKQESNSITLPPMKRAEDYFKEAKLKAETKSDEAIRLYRQGLLLKPDEWQVHAYMGALYEKAGLFVLALPEYELVNRRLPTVESSIDYARALGLTGHSLDSAMVAESGAKKFTDNFNLQLMAGERLMEAGLHVRAITYLVKAVLLKPDSAEASALLGAAYVVAGKPAQGLNAFDKALSSTQTSKSAFEGKKQLLARAMKCRGFLLFPPPEWMASGDSLINYRNGQKIHVFYSDEGEIKEVAVSLATRDIPQGLFENKTLDEGAIAAKIEYHKTALGKSLTRAEILAMGRPKEVPFAVKTVETPEGHRFPSALACASFAWEQKTIHCSCVLTIKTGNHLVSFITKDDKPVAESRAILEWLPDAILLYSVDGEGGEK